MRNTDHLPPFKWTYERQHNGEVLFQKDIKVEVEVTTHGGGVYSDPTIEDWKVTGIAIETQRRGDDGKLKFQWVWLDRNAALVRQVIADLHKDESFAERVQERAWERLCERAA